MSLYTELSTDPLNLGYSTLIAEENYTTILELLNTPNYTKTGWISTSDFNTWASNNNNEYVNIINLSQNINSPFYAAANTVLRALNGVFGLNALNLADPHVMGLFSAWPFVDTIGASKTQLLALGNYPATRAEILGVDASGSSIVNAIANKV